MSDILVSGSAREWLLQIDEQKLSEIIRRRFPDREAQSAAKAVTTGIRENWSMDRIAQTIQANSGYKLAQISLLMKSVLELIFKLLP